MTDLDHLTRRMNDLEAIVREQGYRIKALEHERGLGKWGERLVQISPPNTGTPIGEPFVAYPAVPKVSITLTGGSSAQFCECGKDALLCRAPECPSHKTDPLGR